MKAIEARNLSFSYGEKPLFGGVSFSVAAGECAVLTGPSGSGKTTLCYLLAGIIPRAMEGEYGGEALLFGERAADLPLAEAVQRVGIVFQDPERQLFAPLVEDEVAFGPENLCLPTQEIDGRISEALAAVGMSQYRLSRVNDLSGGQRQLIALAAVLACRPRALILDEALSQLDSESAALVMAALKAQLAQGVAIFMVEHGEEHRSLAGRVYALENGGLREVSP